MHQALTDSQARVLGYESPASDWSATGGVSVGSSADAIQGSHALAVSPQGWTELISAQMGGVSGAREIAELRVKLPAAVSWGEMRLIAQIPSQGHYWRDLGAVTLTGKAPGVWHTLTFQVPSDVRSAMGAASGDLNFRITVNAPSGLGQFLLDDLKISDDEPTGDPEPETSLIRFSLSYPTFANPTEVFLSATSRLMLDDRVTAGAEGESPFVSSIGPETSEFGAGVRVYGSVTSEGNVDFLRSNSTVYGDVKTEGVVVRQNNVSIHGATLQGVDIDSSELEWDVEWPANAVTDVSLPPDTPNTQVAPGVYDALQIFSRATATFTSGSYFFNSFVVEPQAHLKMDTSRGPIQIYVKDVLRLHVGLEFANEEHEQVLFAYLGHQAALFEEALHAAVIAPHSPIELRRPGSGLAHKGAFFGKDVHVFSDATVHFEPLDLSFLCAASAPANALFTELELDPEAFEGNIYCPEPGDFPAGTTQTVNCRRGSSNSEFVSVSEAPVGVREFLFSGAGNDVLMSKSEQAQLLAGPGDDVLCAVDAGETGLFGDAGDDVLYAYGESVSLLPGAGADRVVVTGGSAKIYVNHACEIEPGDTIQVLGGAVTVLSPLSREEMEAAGLSISGTLLVEHMEENPCFSSCSGAPVCGENQECVSGEVGAICVPREPALQLLPDEPDNRYSDLSPEDAEELREFVDRIGDEDFRAVAPREIRAKAPLYEQVLIEAISRNDERYRDAEIFALGSLYTETSLAAMRDIALVLPPKSAQFPAHNESSSWHVGQFHAVRWLFMAADNLEDSERYRNMLLEIVTAQDQRTAEIAVNALRRLLPEPEAEELLRSALGSNHPLLQLTFE